MDLFLNRGGVLALRLYDIHTGIAVEVGECYAERAGGLGSVEDVHPDAEAPLAVVDEQAVRAAQGADDEIRVAVRVVVEESDHVVVFSDV